MGDPTFNCVLPFVIATFLFFLAGRKDSTKRLRLEDFYNNMRSFGF